MQFKPAACVGVVLMASVAAVFSSPALGRGVAGSPCVVKTAKVQGKTAFAYCGPATALLKTGGKTYRFRNGFCQRSLAGGVALQLGTKVVASTTNGGKSYISFGRDKTQAEMAGAFYGGKVIADFAPIKVSGSPLKTNFKGSGFTGTWDCHGTIYQGG